jgi:hypothetical protein
LRFVSSFSPSLFRLLFFRLLFLASFKITKVFYFMIVIDIEHASMDFSLHAQEDICPVDQNALSHARPALSFSRILIVFQFLFFFGACSLPFIKPDILQQVVFGELLVVCIPAFCYLSWMLRGVILHKSL